MLGCARRLLASCGGQLGGLEVFPLPSWHETHPKPGRGGGRETSSSCWSPWGWSHRRGGDAAVWAVVSGDPLCTPFSLLPAAFHPARPARDPRLAGGEDFGEAGWDLQPRGFLSYPELPAAPFGSAPAPSHLHLPVGTGRARPRAFPWFVLSQRPWDRFRCVGPNGYSLKP